MNSTRARRIAVLLWFVASSSSAGDLDDLLDRLQVLPEAVTSGIRDVVLEGQATGWVASGVQVSEGQEVTIFTSSRFAGFARPVTARDLLWLRVGDGDAFSLAGDDSTIRAAHSGELEFATVPPGVRWDDCGGVPPMNPAADDSLEVSIRVLTVPWKTSATAGLQATDHQRAAAALLAYENTPQLPRGFQPLCHLRPAPVFTAWQDDERSGVHGHANGQAGIIKHKLDLPLDDDTEISFDWLYSTLPALGPETDAATHDYSSIAVEFDNGQDITWMWSGHVAAGTTFRCPLRWWDQRETHIVLQSGSQGLGDWHTHTRRIAADYDLAVGGVRPKRIVGVWFISVGAFGDRLADTHFANVTVQSAGMGVDLFNR